MQWEELARAWTRARESVAKRNSPAQSRRLWVGRGKRWLLSRFESLPRQSNGWERRSRWGSSSRRTMWRRERVRFGLEFVLAKYQLAFFLRVVIFESNDNEKIAIEIIWWIQKFFFGSKERSFIRNKWRRRRRRHLQSDREQIFLLFLQHPERDEERGLNGQRCQCHKY